MKLRITRRRTDPSVHPHTHTHTSHSHTHLHMTVSHVTVREKKALQ